MKLGNDLPILPHGIRQNLPHDRPVLKGTTVLELVESFDLLLNEDRPAFGWNGREHSSIKLMLREEIVLARLAAQEIRRLGVAEADRCAGVLLAKEDHVGEVGVLVVFGRCLLAEDAAGWEDGLDGADYEACWVEGKVPSVVLQALY